MPISDHTQSLLIAAVRDAAAQEIRPRFRALSTDDIAAKANPQDLVTAADTGTENALRRTLPLILPGAAILGEEGVAEDPTQLKLLEQGGQTIVIDPIDGTWNFAHGLATFGTIVAVVEDGETVFGLLYDPMLDDWIWAGKGQGTWYGRHRLTTDASAPLDRMIGMLGDNGVSAEEWARIAALYPTFGKITQTGASVWDYRLMSSGEAAFKLNRYLNVWDHAAGVLCLSEAGGYAATLDGTAYHPTMRTGRLLAAASPDLWDRLAPMMRSAVDG